MNVLFVSSGNKKQGISPIVLNQGNSLSKCGVSITYYTIKGKGVKGYLKNIYHLRKKLRDNSYDLIHAHYSLSAIVATLTFFRPVVVSLMGSDVKAKGYWRRIIKLFIRYAWSATIVKTKDLKDSLQTGNVQIIPNGVDFERFKPIEKQLAMEKLGWDENLKHLLFCSDPMRPEKNYSLVKDSILHLGEIHFKMHFLDNISDNELVYYYNAADVVLLSSLWEGSPNVIKEAMACNRPIVATNVGDIKKIFGPTRGCYLSGYNALEYGGKIKRALCYKSTQGREQIEYLNSTVIAAQIIEIYKKHIRK